MTLAEQGLKHSSMSGTTDREEIKRLIEDALVQALSNPIPDNARAGSVYDILRELDERLPNRGKLTTEDDA